MLRLPCIWRTAAVIGKVLSPRGWTIRMIDAPVKLQLVQSGQAVFVSSFCWWACIAQRWWCSRSSGLWQVCLGERQGVL